MRRRGEEQRKKNRENKKSRANPRCKMLVRKKKEEEEILPRCRGVRWRRCASAALVSRGEHRRCCARWRAASLVLRALEKKKRARKKRMRKGKTAALALIFMSDRRRSWERDLLRTIP